MLRVRCDLIFLLIASCLSGREVAIQNALSRERVLWVGVTGMGEFGASYGAIMGEGTFCA